MVADPAFLGTLAADLTAWEVAREEHPLAFERLWHREGTGTDHEGRPRQRTSQRIAGSRMAHHRVGYDGGGNRTGKTGGKLRCFLALALGSDHPDARAFWRGNGIDPDAFPRGPANAVYNDGEIWLVALTSGASIEYHRGTVEAMLKPGTFRWNNRNGRGPALLEVDIPGYEFPAVIRFKSDDMGRRSFQGQKCRGILHDEEGESEEVWDECCTRLVDTNGWHWMANTPVAGVTWVDARLVAKTATNAERDCTVYHLHAVDNPHLSPEGLQNLQRGNRALVAAKLYGRAVQLDGLVYPEWDRNAHAVPRFPIPPLWLRFRSIDFGTRHPFVCLWGAIAKAPHTLPDGRRIPAGALVLYRAHHRPEWTLRQHAEVIRTAEGWRQEPGSGRWKREPTTETIEMTWADPEDPQQLLQLNEEHDLDASPAIKAIRAGIDAVSERLQPHVDGLPSLFVFDDLVDFIREIEGYVWAEGSAAKDQPDRPRSKDDHEMDCVRYMAMGLRAGDY
jgi:phage terminase large subunit-like protein